MRVVIDTNVLVSAIINPEGAPGKVTETALKRTNTALYDDRIFSEYLEVLTRPAFGFDPEAVNGLLNGIEQGGDYVSGKRLDVTLPDETDLPFLEVAVAGFADALVTGNAKHFKPVKGRHNVNILTPAEFMGRPI